MLLRELFLKRIFVILVIGFCTGILCYYYLPMRFSSLFFYTGFSLPFVFLIHKKYNPWFQLTFLFMLFVALGYLSIFEKNHSNIHKPDFSTYQNNEVYEAKIVEISFGEKLWNKAILKLNYQIEKDNKVPISEKVLFLINEELSDLEKGDVLLLNSTLQPIKNKGNPGEFDAEKYWQAKGISRIGFLVGEECILQKKEKNSLLVWFNWMDKSLSDLFENSLNPEAIGIAKALILGDRDHLDSESVRSFSDAGAMHVLAVSGLHVGLILAFLMFVLGRFPKYISKYRATVLALIIIWFYALLTGFSPSVFRAVVMFSLLTLAKISGKNYDPINVLMISAFILLLYDPLLLFDLGFELSYLAMLGIFLLYKPIVEIWYISNKWGRLIWEGTAISLSAQVFTLPLTLYFFHQFPNYFLISNIGLMVLTNVVLIVGVLFISLQLVPFVSAILAWTLSMSVLAMFVFVQWVEKLPGSTAKGFEVSTTEIGFLYLLILVSLLFFKQKRLWSMSGSALIVIFCFIIVSNRYKNIQTNEWVVCNENKLTLLLKMEDQIYCFYENDDDLPRSVYLAQNYQKIRSGNINYCKISNTILELEDPNFSFTCKDENSFYDISVNDKNWRLIKRITPENNKFLNEKCIYMPYLKLENVTGHLLNEGAFIRRI